MARFSLISIAVALLFAVAVSGCGLTSPSPPPSGQLNIETVAGWYQFYRSRHGGKYPPSEEELVSFIKSELQSRNAPLDESIFISPRDGQKYVIHYGKPVSTNPEKNLAVYEKEGYGGKKMIAFESKWSQEVDDAELQRLLAGK